MLLIAGERDTAAYVQYVTSAGKPFSLMPPCLPLPIVVYPGTYSEMTVEEIRRLTVEAGRVPVERDTLYHEVVREGGTKWKKGKKLLALA